MGNWSGVVELFFGRHAPFNGSYLFKEEISWPWKRNLNDSSENSKEPNLHFPSLAHHITRDRQNAAQPQLGRPTLTWDALNQIKERIPLLKPKLRLPYGKLQALALL